MWMQLEQICKANQLWYLTVFLTFSWNKLHFKEYAHLWMLFVRYLFWELRRNLEQISFTDNYLIYSCALDWNQHTVFYSDSATLLICIAKWSCVGFPWINSLGHGAEVIKKRHVHAHILHSVVAATCRLLLRLAGGDISLEKEEG